MQSRVVARPSGNPDFDKALIRAVDAAGPFAAPEQSVEDQAKKGIELTFRAKP